MLSKPQKSGCVWPLLAFAMDLVDSSGSRAVVHQHRVPVVFVGAERITISHAARDRCACSLLQAVVFSEGKLYLDDCDFSGCTSSVLVKATSRSTAEIRNIVLGNNNCESRRGLTRGILLPCV